MSTNVPLVPHSDQTLLRRRPRRSRQGRTEGPSQLAARVSNLERRIVFNPKWINPGFGTLTNTITNTVPYTFCVNAVAQGTGENARIGAKIRMKSFEANLICQSTATAQQDTVLTYRIYVVKESTTLGSNVAVAQMFLDTNPVPASMRDHTNRDASRYHVLYDSGIQTLGCLQSALASPFANLATPCEKAHTIKFKCDILSDQSRANNGNVGDIDTNGVSFVILADCTAAYLTISGAYLTQFVDV
jgi:hypothetical protein